jgi:hypothetical protein
VDKKSILRSALTFRPDPEQPKKVRPPGPDLAAAVRDGRQALKREYRALLVEPKPAIARVVDSLDLDACFKPYAESESRWDYLVGVFGPGKKERVIAVEVHRADDNEVPKMINKVKAAKRQLKDATGKASVVDGLWHWLATSGVHVSPGTARARQLKEAGIAAPKKRLLLPNDLDD